MRIVVSSGEQARDGLALDQLKWDLPRSGRAPLLDSHSDLRKGIRSIIGRVDDFGVRTIEFASGRSGPALLGTATFAEADVSADAEVALQLYRCGYADSFSVSFIPNWDGASNRMTPASQELLEVSAVAVPADVNSTVFARAIRRQLSGSETAADRQAIAEAIAARVRRDDDLAGGRECETSDDRRARAIFLQARLSRETS